MSTTSRVTDMSSVDPGVGRISSTIPLGLTNMSPYLKSRLEPMMGIYIRPEWRKVLSSALYSMQNRSRRYKHINLWHRLCGFDISEKIYKLRMFRLCSLKDQTQACIDNFQVFVLPLNPKIHQEYWSDGYVEGNSLVVCVVQDTCLAILITLYKSLRGWITRL